MKKILTILIVCLYILSVSCGDINDIDKIVDEISNSTDFNVSYIKDRNIIRIDSELSKDVVEGAVIYKSMYNEWNIMKNSLSNTYNSIEKLVYSKNIKKFRV